MVIKNMSKRECQVWFQDQNFMKKSLLFAIFAIGFSALVAQMLILRELLIVFAGNELSIGIILANWLLLGGFGSFIMGRRAEKITDRTGVFTGIALLFSVSLPAAIYVTRILKNMLGVAIGEGLGFSTMLYSSFLILLPISISNGALFTLGCRIYPTLFNKDASSIGKVYIYGTVGTIVGGIVWTYVLIPFLNAFQIALSLAALNMIACIILLVFSQKANALRKITIYASGLLFIICIFLLFSGKTSDLHYQSIKSQWKPLNMVHYQNSIHGNITVTETQGQFTFFLDGIEHITIPIPDRISVEEFVHPPMLSHPDPKSILILGSGAGGVINEILKHPTVETIDYAELDPLLIELIRKFPAQLTEMELEDDRVRVKHTDGRLFLNVTEYKYDLIYVGPSNPSDMRTNRYFTKEFFTLARERLTKNGILVLRLPGCLTNLTYELENLNSGIFHTLRKVFPYIRVFPGAGRNLFLASYYDGILKMDSMLLINRLKERNLAEHMAIPWHIERMLHPGWTNWFTQFIKDATLSTNHDFDPRGVFYSISHWNTFYAPYLRQPFRLLNEIDLPKLFGAFIIFIALFLLYRTKNKKSNISGIPLCVATTGFAGMVFDLVLIFTFQAIYGYVFAWIGLLVASFMTGITAGAMLMIHAFKRIRHDLRFFMYTDLSVAGFALLLPAIFLSLRPYLDNPDLFPLLKALFLVLSCISGFLVGSQFPLANKIYLNKKDKANFSETAGLIYGADLLGGGLGGIIGGVILFPLLGFLGTCLVIVLLKLSSFIIIASKQFTS